jgi:hypothetical protein
MYPTKEAWEQSQQMAKGGIPNIMGVPFGAGITMAHGGTPYYGGPLQPIQDGAQIPVKWPTFKTASEHDKFVAKNPNLRLYSPQDLEGLGLVRPLAPDPNAIKKQNKYAYNPAGVTPEGAGLFNNAQGQPFTFSDGMYNPYSADAIASDLPPNKYGGLPGGPHQYDMPCMNCGGYMEDGGNASPFNYGAFPAMQGGGDADMAALWLAQQQFALQKRTGEGLPSGVKPTGTNPLNFNPYLKGSDIAQPDSMHTNPYDPKIAAYFKGNKMIAGPAENTGPAINAARKINTGKLYKKDNTVYPNYRQTGGNFQDNGSYPMMNNGGIDYSSTINDVFSKYQKKAGGDITKQGGNQDYITNMNNAFKGAIQRNVMNKFNQDERDLANQVTQQATQEVEQAYQGYAMGGGPGMSYGYNSYDAPNLDNQYNQEMHQAKLDSYNDQHALDRQNMRGANQMLAYNIDRNLAGQRASEQYWDSFATPKAQSGGDWDAAYAQQVGEEAQRTEAYSMEKKKAKDAYIASLRQQGKPAENTQQATAQNSYGDINWKQFAQEFGPQGRVNGLNYFPANMRQHYQMNKAGKKAFMDLPENFKTKGLEVERTYGPVARTWFGNKLGLGARKVNIKLTGESDWENTPYNQGPQVRLSDPTNPLLNPNAEQNPHVILDPTRNNNLGPAIQTTPNPNFNWDLSKQAYGGHYAQSGLNLNPNPINMGQGIALTGAPPATSFIGAPPAIDYKANAGIKDPEINKFTQRGEKGTNKLTAEAQLNRKWQGLGQTIGQYAVPGINMIAGMFEQDDLQNSEQALEQGMLADNAKVVRPGNAFDMGTWGTNNGVLRENQYNYSQQPGFNAQFGGFNTMQNGGEQGDTWEDDLTEDEIENLKAQGYNIEYLD